MLPHSLLMAHDVSCPRRPQLVNGQLALRNRIYNISEAADMRVVWRQRFRAFANEQPLSVPGASQYCRWLSHQQWPFCRHAVADAAGMPAPSPREAVLAATSRLPRDVHVYNTLMLVSMPCAFTDEGSNFRGALYDSRRILNAQHRSATPRFARGAVDHYPIAAVGLTPYGHLADSHFYASTAPWVLQLLHLLPEDVPILVSLSKRLRELYLRLGVQLDRLKTLPRGGAAYADRMLSLVTTPFGALEPLGAASLALVQTRLRRVPMPPRNQRMAVILLSRADQAPRRSLRNEAALLHALEAVVGPAYAVEVFRGAQRDQRMVDRAATFSRAALLTGPHGGAFLNAIYCASGTPIVEIGYKSKHPMPYPSYYLTYARRLELPFWLVLGEGAYDRPITAPVGEIAGLVQALLSAHQRSGRESRGEDRGA